jgi:hypothetical protein
MKSRVSVDVDIDNQPIIKVEYTPSDDVRDKLVKTFLETFGSGSSWTRITFQYVPDAPVINNTIFIRPIPPRALGKESEEMNNMHIIMNTPCIPPQAESVTPIYAAKENPLLRQSAHSISECLAALKWSRPAAGQKFLDECIKKANKLFPPSKLPKVLPEHIDVFR